MGNMHLTTVSYDFSVPRETVFDVWLNPTSAHEWMGDALKSMGLAGEMADVEIDPVKGGKFLFSDIRNGKTHRHWGEYIELERPAKITFTWNTEGFDEDEPCNVYLTFNETRNGCTVTIVNEMDEKWADDNGATARGWRSMLLAQDALFRR